MCIKQIGINVIIGVIIIGGLINLCLYACCLLKNLLRNTIVSKVTKLKKCASILPFAQYSSNYVRVDSLNLFNKL